MQVQNKKTNKTSLIIGFFFLAISILNYFLSYKYIDSPLNIYIGRSSLLPFGILFIIDGLAGRSIRKYFEIKNHYSKAATLTLYIIFLIVLLILFLILINDYGGTLKTTFGRN